MNSPWIERLGNWNPQLLREFRGRLRMRSFVAAIALSLIVQALILLIFLQGYHDPLPSDWAELWKGLSGIFPYILICIGGYYLVTNLTQEEKSGTLNFIRLSPRPAWQILLGKLLGVPILPTIALVLFLPLHLITGILGQIPLRLMVSFYLLLGVGCLLSWSFAILFGLTGSHHTGLAGQVTTLSIAYVAVALSCLVPLWYVWNVAITWRPLTAGYSILTSSMPVVEWIWTPINQNAMISHGFTLVNCGVILLILWRVMLRRFRRPRATLLSRRQSYGVMAYLLTLVLGFFLNARILRTSNVEMLDKTSNDFFQASSIAVMLIFAYFLSLILMRAICPGRQALMEWSRQPNQTLMGFIWSDKSPVMLSHGILLIIANMILVPLAILFPYGSENPGELSFTLLYLIIILGVTSTLMMIGTFMQYIFTLKLRNPSIWFLVSLLLWWVVPPIFLGILGLSVESISATATIWAFFGYPLGHLTGAENLPLVFFGIFAQWGVTALLIKNIQQSLNKFRGVGLEF